MNSLRSTIQVSLVNEYIVKKGRAFDNDMERIHVYLSRGNYYKSTINEIFETIYTDLKRLRTSPKIGAKLSNKTTIPNEYRYLVSGDYVIFYKVYEKEALVKVFHIYHGKENYLSKLNLNERQIIQHKLKYYQVRLYLGLCYFRSNY